MDEKDKVIINNLIEDKKILWTIMIVLTGGLVGLGASITEFSFSFYVIFRILGILFDLFIWYFMAINLMNVTSRINKKLRR